MYFPLTDAPVNTPLELMKVQHIDLEYRLRRMGFYRGCRFRLMDEEVMLQSIRIRGPKGEAVIPPGMTIKIIVHLDDGRKLPLAEMQPGESGHIEGRTGGIGLQKSLDILGFGIDDKITLVRRLPSMEYVTFIETNDKRVKIPEGIAAKILGQSGLQTLQFCSSPTGKPFNVSEILGGKNARHTVGSFDIAIGDVLILEQVRAGQEIYMSNRKPRYILSTSEGMRLFLEDYQARKVFVRTL